MSGKLDDVMKVSRVLDDGGPAPRSLADMPGTMASQRRVHDALRAAPPAWVQPAPDLHARVLDRVVRHEVRRVRPGSGWGAWAGLSMAACGTLLAGWMWLGRAAHTAPSPDAVAVNPDTSPRANPGAIAQGNTTTPVRTGVSEITASIAPPPFSPAYLAALPVKSEPLITRRIEAPIREQAALLAADTERAAQDIMASLPIRFSSME